MERAPTPARLPRPPPSTLQQAKQLVSEDVQNAVRRYKHAFAVEMVPLCKDDVAVLPARVAAGCGSISPLVLVTRVSSVVQLLDPRTLQVRRGVAGAAGLPSSCRG